MKFKMYWDYLLYITTIKIDETFGFGLDAFVFIFSILAASHEWRSLAEGMEKSWVIIAVLLLVVIKSLREIWKFLHEFREFFYLENAELITPEWEWDKVKPSRKEEDEGFIKEAINPTQQVIYSPRLNEYLLQNRPLKVILSDFMPIKIKHFIRENKEVVLRFLTYQFNYSLKRRRNFVNKIKLCLSQDLDIRAGLAVCHRGEYYDSFLTNEAAGRYLEDQNTGKKIADLSFLFPISKDKCGDLRFDDLTTSLMNNHIGISTLGITKDGYLIIWRGNNTNQFNNGLLTPTGSGSCEISDLAPDDNFYETITRAMERELREESCSYSSCPADFVRQTKVLGFFRWLARGGKPEFVGLTKLNRDYVEFSPNTKEVRTSLEDSKLRPHYVPTTEKLLETIEFLLAQKDLSVPLLMNLKFLQTFATLRPQELQQFLMRK